jgi:hypothetical protein
MAFVGAGSVNILSIHFGRKNNGTLLKSIGKWTSANIIQLGGSAG